MSNPWDNRALSTIARNVLKENNEEVKEKLSLLTAATGGKPWTFEADYATIEKTDNLKETAIYNCLQILVASFIPGVSYELKNYSPLKFETFVKNATSHKIIFQLVPDSEWKNQDRTGYHDATIRDGNVYLLAHRSQLANGSSHVHCGDSLFSNIAPSGGNSLHIDLQEGIRANKTICEEHLERLEKCTQVSGWTLDIDWAEWQKRMPEETYSALPSLLMDTNINGLVAKIEAKCGDTFFLEDIVEKANKRKIVFEFGPEKEMKALNYCRHLFRDGALVMQYKQEKADRIISYDLNL